MIRYALTCEQAHEFESWFPSADSYETQKKRGFLSCPTCGSLHVDKQVMSPAVSGTTEIDTPSQTAQPVAIISEKEQVNRALLRAFRERVEQNSEHVGKRFPEEARKMHYGEIEYRSIFGEASLSEARSLIEEGIDVLPLPILPDDHN